MLDNGADLNKATADVGLTPLFVAAHEDKSEAVRVFLDYGADLNKATTDAVRTPLYTAAERGFLGVV